MTAFLGLVAGWPQVFSSHQERSRRDLRHAQLGTGLDSRADSRRTCAVHGVGVSAPHRQPRGPGSDR